MDIDRHPFERSFGDQAPKNHSISLKGIRKIIRTLPNEFTGDQFFEAMSKSRKTLSGSYSESFSTKVLKKALD